MLAFTCLQVIAAVEERVSAPNGAALLLLGQVFDDHPDLQQMMLENPQVSWRDVCRVHYADD